MFIYAKIVCNALVSGQLSRPEVVWNKTFENLIDDILNIQRQVLGALGNDYA